MSESHDVHPELPKIATSSEVAPSKLAILLSGRGSNFLTLHEAIEQNRLPAEIAVVISNVAGAPGLEAARRLGLPALAIPHKGESSRESHEGKIFEALEAAKVEWVCLAGYMRRLSGSFVRHFPHRMLNIHPSLLPAFPGLRAQRQALEHGVRTTGCTVHLVDEFLDNGPIVVQRAVSVEDDDTEESLSRRLLREEHKAYSEALRRLLLEPWRVEGRRLVFGPRVRHVASKK